MTKITVARAEKAYRGEQVVIAVLGARVFRHAMAYFTASVVALLLAEGSLALGFFNPAAYAAPLGLVTVHLTTVGWLTLLMLGALAQFLPVIGARPLHSEQEALATLVLVGAGLTGMLLGFASLALGGSLAAALPVGGSLVVLGVGVGVHNLFATLKGARVRTLAARFVAAGLTFLLVTVALGLLLALALSGVAPLPAALATALLTHGLWAHLAGGVGGFFTLVAMGVAQKLLSMFTLAPEERGWLGEVAFFGTAGGAALLWLALWAEDLTPLAAYGADAGWVAALTGVMAFLVDMARLYAERRRRALELNARWGILAFASLGAGSGLLAVALALSRQAWLVAALYLLAFGWLGGLGLTQLYKIVPFLTWLERYGPRLGKGVLPRVQDLVVEPRAAPFYLCYFVGVALGSLAIGLDQLPLLRFAAMVSLVGSAGVARELWRARHATPEVNSEAAARSSPPRVYPERGRGSP